MCVHFPLLSFAEERCIAAEDFRPLRQWAWGQTSVREDEEGVRVAETL